MQLSRVALAAFFRWGLHRISLSNNRLILFSKSEQDFIRKLILALIPRFINCIFYLKRMFFHFQCPWFFKVLIDKNQLTKMVRIAQFMFAHIMQITFPPIMHQSSAKPGNHSCISFRILTPVFFAKVLGIHKITQRMDPPKRLTHITSSLISMRNRRFCNPILYNLFCCF